MWPILSAYPIFLILYVPNGSKLRQRRNKRIHTFFRIYFNAIQCTQLVSINDYSFYYIYNSKFYDVKFPCCQLQLPILVMHICCRHGNWGCAKKQTYPGFNKFSRYSCRRLRYPLRSSFRLVLWCRSGWQWSLVTIELYNHKMNITTEFYCTR